MVGAKLIHNRVSKNVLVALSQQLDGSPCEAFTSDQRVYIPTSKAYLYPDVLVVCGEPDVMHMSGVEMILNPMLIIEVLSPSTAHYDRTIKRELYQSIPSLRAYLMVSQDQPLIEVIERSEENHWVTHQWNETETIGSLPSLGLSFPLPLIYENVW